MIKSTTVELTYQQKQRFLNHYFFFSYLIIQALCLRYLSEIQFSSNLTILFSSFVFLTYGFIYLLPAILLTKITCFFLYIKNKSLSKKKNVTVYFIAILFTAITSFALLVDQTIFSLYGFHLNGFVLNLLITPGGIEALGASDSAVLTIMMLLLAFIAFYFASFLIMKKYYLSKLKRAPEKHYKIYRYLIAILVLMTTSERIVYGIAHLQGNRPVLAASNAFPFYQPVTFRSLAKDLGYKGHREIDLSGPEKSFRLSYPLKPLSIERPEKPLNIVWLVAESWRWDMLDNEIMPMTWNFSQKAYRFTNCYSGGNGTRMSIFAMFYGLYSPYWFTFLNERRSPVIMDVVQSQNYQLGLFTSAKFSYPEFDKTVFANVPDESLHEYRGGRNWERDRKNVSDLIDFIKNRDQSLPFMTFLFFESPHARYYFPKDSIIRDNYLEDFNYATMSLEKDIGLIFNRYINACHHLDSQHGRILDLLKKEKLLENTIVIITGDHGEEFMEKGRWGHNSEFHEEQVKVPLVIYIPDSGSGVIDRMVSHLDVPPTIMPILGVKNDSGDYSLGHDLFGPTKRQYTVLGDWDSIGIVTGSYKARFPVKNILAFQTKVTTKNDQPVKEVDRFYDAHQETLKEIIQSLSKFGYKQ
ncbi:MAG: sulfatase-like hydrolase/transferase [Deltaproteobacteria bacterium]|nr:sulfatase-like hydrolase/transferase [Deltaproteobacteria bacterium]